jgi:hypothetical protein
VEYPQVVVQFTFRIVPSIALTTGGRGHLFSPNCLVSQKTILIYAGSRYLSSSGQDCILFDGRDGEKLRHAANAVGGVLEGSGKWEAGNADSVFLESYLHVVNFLSGESERVI